LGYWNKQSAFVGFFQQALAVGGVLLGEIGLNYLRKIGITEGKPAPSSAGLHSIRVIMQLFSLQIARNIYRDIAGGPTTQHGVAQRIQTTGRPVTLLPSSLPITADGSGYMYVKSTLALIKRILVQNIAECVLVTLERRVYRRPRITIASVQNGNENLYGTL